MPKYLNADLSPFGPPEEREAENKKWLDDIRQSQIQEAKEVMEELKKQDWPD